MKRIITCFGLLLGGLALFFAGFFSRQPKINKLKAQIKRLQNEIIKLQALRDKQNETINRLLIDYKSIKVYSVFKRKKQKKTSKRNWLSNMEQGSIYNYCWTE